RVAVGSGEERRAGGAEADRDAGGRGDRSPRQVPRRRRPGGTSRGPDHPRLRDGPTPRGRDGVLVEASSGGVAPPGRRKERRSRGDGGGAEGVVSENNTGHFLVIATDSLALVSDASRTRPSTLSSSTAFSNSGRAIDPRSVPRRISASCRCANASPSLL